MLQRCQHAMRCCTTARKAARDPAEVRWTLAGGHATAATATPKYGRHVGMMQRALVHRDSCLVAFGGVCVASCLLRAASMH